MKREQVHFAIGRTLDVPMATKYGALDHLRSAIGIIYSKKGRIAMAITCDDMPDVNWSVDNPAYLLMSRLSVILIDGLGREKASALSTQSKEEECRREWHPSWPGSLADDASLATPSVFTATKFRESEPYPKI